ncbi:class IV adenylate cyclase [Candidatus Fermentibacterales bacterium]|nr:class IV adenylate cyclase [Candidatus Fermentibacterales bacterium]
MIEIEVKFPIGEDAAWLETALVEQGFSGPEAAFERSFVYDRIEGERLAETGVLLRLRESCPSDRPEGPHTVRLTVKTPVEAPGCEGLKARRELEALLGCGAEDARAMLEALGFRVAFSYDRVRRSYRKEGVRVCLDSLEFGSFVEIEASRPEEVRSTAVGLGLDPSSGISESYMQLARAAEGRRV